MAELLKKLLQNFQSGKKLALVFANLR